MTENPLTSKQRQAAVLTAEDTLSDEEIAKEVGVARMTLHRWRELPAFKDAVSLHATELEKQMLRLAIARRRYRVRILNDLHAKSLAVIGARAGQYGEIPGGDTGLLVGQLKQVKHINVSDEGTETWTEEHWEYAVDTALMREIRGIQEQAAKELGQWVDKSEQSGTLTNTVRLIGVAAEDI